MPIKPALVVSDPDHVNWENIILLAGVLVSVVTFVIQSYITRDQDRTARRLELLNKQLGDVYGPLQGRLDAANNAKQSARFSLKQKRLLPWQKLYEDENCTQENQEFRWFGYDENDQAVEQDPRIVLLWRRWVREVVQPNNEAMLEILLNNTHLLVLETQPEDDVNGDGVMDRDEIRNSTPQMPKQIGEAIRHFLSYRPLIKEWDEEEERCIKEEERCRDQSGTTSHEDLKNDLNGWQSRLTSELGEDVSLTPLERRVKNLKSYQNTATVSFPKAFPKYVDRCWRQLCEERHGLVVTLPATGKSPGERFLVCLWTPLMKVWNAALEAAAWVYRKVTNEPTPPVLQRAASDGKSFMRQANLMRRDKSYKILKDGSMQSLSVLGSSSSSRDSHESIGGSPSSSFVAAAPVDEPPKQVELSVPRPSASSLRQSASSSLRKTASFSHGHQSASAPAAAAPAASLRA